MHPPLPSEDDTEVCPVCRADWMDKPIPLEYRDKYYGGKTHYSRLIGVELPEVYDGVHHWRCPDCGSEFARF
jgi:hypothetical protein